MKKGSRLILTFILILNLSSHSQVSTQSQPHNKLALVIGNGNYVSSSILANPENDARAMKDALQSVGFSVMEYENLTQSQMKKAIDDFGAKLKSSDVGLFFYAGHGIQSKGYNYLIPVEAQLQSEQQVEYDCVQADRVLALMEASGSKVNIIILDACRNNPFERSWTRSSTGRGLAFMNAPSGTLIAYATSPGTTASDGSGNNGLYTSAILESMKIPNITIIEMFQNVRSIVSEKSNKQQIPWESTSMTGNFYFNWEENPSARIIETLPETPVLEITNSKIQNNTKENTLIKATTLDGVDYIIDSRDNQQYKTVKIGNQVWMAENLKTTLYNDGTNIPLIIDKNEWSNLITPGFCWYDNDEATYKETYGALYNWYAAMTNKLCPIGWHIPSDADWNTLTKYLHGTVGAGGKLKEAGTTHWKMPNTGATNESGFTALPGGYRFYDGTFNYVGSRVYWWSSTAYNTSDAWILYLLHSKSDEYRLFSHKTNGFSVRCLLD